MADVRDIRRIAFERFHIDIDLPESSGVYPATMWIEFVQHRKEPVQCGFAADELELIADQFQEMAERLRKIDDALCENNHGALVDKDGQEIDDNALGA